MTSARQQPDPAAPLFRLSSSVVGQRDRRLFQELNPEHEYSPILKAPPKTPRPASVLIPVMMRPTGLSILFTVRSPAMPSHAGEISFPGGGPKRGDRDAVATALREAEEEVGIPSNAVEIAGSFGAHFGGLGYVVTPVVGLVRRPQPITPCDREVSDTFEVPLSFITDLDNHIIIDREFNNVPYKMFAIPYEDECGERYIWGLTAGILHTFAMAWHDRPLGP